jgi:hypothetical protein
MGREILFIHWALSPQFRIRYSLSRVCCYTEFVCEKLLNSCTMQYWTVLPPLSTVWTWPATYYLLDVPWKPNLFFLSYNSTIGQTCILLVLRQLVWDTCSGYCMVVVCAQHHVRHDEEMTSGSHPNNALWAADQLLSASLWEWSLVALRAK